MENNKIIKNYIIMGYLSWKEDEAFREGRRDAECGRRNYDYHQHFGSNVDKAYYDGQREYEREQERRRELLEEERREEERQERRNEERRQYLRDLEEEEYYKYMSDSHREPSDDLPF